MKDLIKTFPINNGRPIEKEPEGTLRPVGST
jgi:hypothetical protein